MTDINELIAENKHLKSQLNSARHLLKNQRLLLEEYSFNKHLPSIESEREANQILTNENQNLIAENAGLKNQRDELLEALNNALPLLHTGDEIPMSYYADKPGVLGEALRAIARAKGE